MTAIRTTRSATRMRELITETFLYMRPDFAFDDTESLIGLGVIDSLGVMELITLVETEFGIHVEDEDVTEAHFGSVFAIAAYVDGKLRSDDDSPSTLLAREA